MEKQTLKTNDLEDQLLEEQKELNNVCKEILGEIFDLVERKEQCKNENNFKEAGLIMKELQELGVKYKELKLRELEIKQVNDIKKFEIEIEDKIDEYDRNVENNLKEFDNEVHKIHENLKEKNQKIIDSTIKNLENIQNENGKPTPQILDIHFRIQNLVKQQNFDEAHLLSMKLENLEKNCIDRNNSEMNHKIEKHLEKIKNKHDIEFEAYLTKNKTHRNNLTQKYEKEKQILLNKLKADYNKKINEYKHNFNNKKLYLKKFLPTEINFKSN